MAASKIWDSARLKKGHREPLDRICSIIMKIKCITAIVKWKRALSFKFYKNTMLVSVVQLFNLNPNKLLIIRIWIFPLFCGLTSDYWLMETFRVNAKKKSWILTSSCYHPNSTVLFPIIASPLGIFLLFSSVHLVYEWRFGPNEIRWNTEIRLISFWN